MLNSKKGKIQHNKNGFIALASVIIMSGFFLIIFVSMFFSATSQIERARDGEFLVRALGLANSCVEEALNELKHDLGYKGEEIINIGENTCEVMNIEGTDMAKIIKSQGSVGGYTKRVQVEVDIFDHPYMEIIDWRVVSEFSDL